MINIDVWICKHHFNVVSGHGGANFTSFIYLQCGPKYSTGVLSITVNVSIFLTTAVDLLERTLLHCQESFLNKLFHSWSYDVLSGIVCRRPCQQMTSGLFNSGHHSNIYISQHWGPLTGPGRDLLHSRLTRGGGELFMGQESCDKLTICSLSFVSLSWYKLYWHEHLVLLW